MDSSQNVPEGEKPLNSSFAFKEGMVLIGDELMPCIFGIIK
jgi:hypothetical protein